MGRELDKLLEGGAAPPYCQSCYMPMDLPGKFGTELDGVLSEEYCTHCYQAGEFTTEQTLDEAIEANIMYWKSQIESDDTARERMMKIFPHLKRWKKQ